MIFSNRLFKAQMDWCYNRTYKIAVFCEWAGSGLESQGRAVGLLVYFTLNLHIGAGRWVADLLKLGLDLRLVWATRMQVTFCEVWWLGLQNVNSLSLPCNWQTNKQTKQHGFLDDKKWGISRPLPPYWWLVSVAISDFELSLPPCKMYLLCESRGIQERNPSAIHLGNYFVAIWDTYNSEVLCN